MTSKKSIKKRHRVASIIETKSTPQPELNFNKNKTQPSNLSKFSSNHRGSLSLDFVAEEDCDSSQDTLSSDKPPSAIHSDIEETEPESLILDTQPKAHSLYNDTDEELTFLYQKDATEPFSYPPTLLFFLAQRYGAEKKFKSLPLTWGALCLKFAALFNEIQLAVLHSHTHKYFTLIHELVLLTTRLLTLLPHSPQDGKKLLPKAREVVNATSRLVLELFEASGTWASSEDSLADARFSAVSVSTSLFAVRDFLQGAQYHSVPFNAEIVSQLPYLPLLSELHRLANITDYKYLLRVEFLAERVSEANHNLLSALSTGHFIDKPMMISCPETSFTSMIGDSSKHSLIDAIKFYVASVGHFLSLVRWVLMVPHDGPGSPAAIILRHLNISVLTLQTWAKLTLHTLTPTLIRRVSELGLGRSCLDLAPWMEGVTLSHTCLEALSRLLKNPQHLNEMPELLPPLDLLMGASDTCDAPNASTPSVASAHKVLSNSCIIRALRHDVDSTLQNFKTHLTASSEPNTPMSANHDSDLPRSGGTAASIIYHADNNGRVRLATWAGLIELLAPKDRAVDSTFLRVFFLTFRFFATPRQLFYALIDLFEDATGGSPLPVNIRISNALLSWLELYYFEEDYQIVPLIREFSETKLTRSMPAAGKRLLETTRTILDSQLLQSPPEKNSYKNHLLSLSESDTPGSPRRKDGFIGGMGKFNFPRFQGMGASNMVSNPVNPLLEWGPTVLASALTLLDAELFNKIGPQHIISYVAAKAKSKGHKQIFSNKPCMVKKLVDWSNQVNHWVVETILWEEDIKQRVSIIKCFINITERLINICNFNMAIAILSALNSSAITRLNSTWSTLSAKYKSLLAQHNNLFDPHRNFAAYRARLKAINMAKPFIPFFGTFLTDMTFFLQGNSTYRALSTLSPRNSSPPSPTATQLPSLNEKASPSEDLENLSFSNDILENSILEPLEPSDSSATQSTEEQTILAPWEPIPEVEYINFDKFYRMVQILDGFKDRQNLAYKFPSMERPQTTAQVVRDHIFGLPSAPLQPAGPPTPDGMKSEPELELEMEPPPQAFLPNARYSLDDLLESGYEPTKPERTSKIMVPPTAAASRICSIANPSPSTPFNITYTLTMEDYYQKSLRLEPPPNSPVPH